MELSILESLPTEILIRIGDYVASTRKRHLHAFSLASKSAHSIAEAILSASLTIEVQCGRQLAIAIRNATERLQRTSSFHCVRRLTVTGSLLLNTNDPGEVVPKLQGYRFNGPLEDDGGNLDEPLSDWDLDVFRSDCRGADAADPPWRPLADLVKRLPVLSDLIFSSPDQLPPCLLQILSEKIPQCWLHLGFFRLRSLNDPEIDPHEIALITSPRLRGLRLQCRSEYLANTARRQHPEFSHDYNLEIVRLMVAGLAHNLRKVCLVRGYGTSGSKRVAALGSPVPPLQKIRPDLWQARRTKGSLCSLRFAGSFIYLLSDLDIQAWSECTEFSLIRSLALENVVTGGALQLLLHSCDSPSLEELSIHVSGRATQFDQDLQLFLSRQAPLRRLRLSGAHRGEMLDVAITQHGSALRELRLVPSSYSSGLYGLLVEGNSVNEIKRSCPLLEILELTVAWSHGAAGEVSIFKALGSFPRLKELSLRLFVKQPAEFRPGFRPPPGGVPDRVLRNYLINVALDEDLVRAIFASIASGTAAGSLTLQTLHLRVERHTGGYIEGDNMIGNELLRHLEGGVWLAERQPMNDGCGPVLVTAASRPTPRTVSEAPGEGSYCALSSYIARTFREIWPETAPGSQWRDDWHSFPLAES